MATTKKKTNKLDVKPKWLRSHKMKFTSGEIETGNEYVVRIDMIATVEQLGSSFTRITTVTGEDAIITMLYPAVMALVLQDGE